MITLGISAPRQAAKSVADNAEALCKVIGRNADSSQEVSQLNASLQAVSKFDLRGRGDVELAKAIDLLRSKCTSLRNLAKIREAAGKVQYLASFAGDAAEIKQRRFRAAVSAVRISGNGRSCAG